MPHNTCRWQFRTPIAHAWVDVRMDNGVILLLKNAQITQRTVRMAITRTLMIGYVWPIVQLRVS